MSTPRVDTSALLRAIVESSDDAIVSKDLNGIVTSWNRAAEQVFGYTSAEMVGRSIRAIIPADRQSEEDRVLAAVRRGEKVEHFETVRQTKTGELIPISLTVSPVYSDDGQLVGASKIARDIRDRVRAEEAAAYDREQDAFLAQVTSTLSESLDYQRTLATIALCAVPRIADWCAVDLVGEDGVVLRVAQAHVDESRVELMQRVHEEYGDTKALTSPHMVIRTGQAALLPDITDEMLVTAAAGDAPRLALLRSVAFSSYMCVPMTAHGRAVGAITFTASTSGRHYTAEDVHFARDVAARAALAVENARAYEQVRSTNRLKDEFLATLSHEMRTPLNAVLGYARMLRSGTIAVERREQALEVIERNATSLAQIVEDVLDVSRIISGKARLSVQPLTLSRILDDAVAAVQPAADAKGVHITTALDPHAGSVSGDPDRLQQVVWNLLMNAVKFTPRGQTVRVQLESTGPHVRVTVADTGMGIAPDFLPHIFERFRQAEGGTTRQHGGLGLGLAIARHIVELHGGTIEAESEGPGKGATFRVDLPTLAAS